MTNLHDFETFYREHFEDVRTFVVRRVGDPHVAADLIAEIFVAVIDSAHTYRPSLGDPKRWLYGVARNVVSSERRRQARELDAIRRISGRAFLDDDDIADLVARIDAEAQARALYAAMDDMSDDDRGLLELVAVDGLRVSDAAKVLGISPVTARVRLHRARRALRDRLSVRFAWVEGAVAEEASS